MENPPERWPARSGQSVYAGIAVVVLLVGYLVFVRVSSNNERREGLEFCALMTEAFDAGDDTKLATARTNQARRLVAPGGDPLGTSIEGYLAAEWWHLRHGDGFLHGEEPTGHEVADLPPRKPATQSVDGDVASKERGIRQWCAQLAER